MNPKPSGENARSLLRGLLWVGTIGFGGGSALIPVLASELVEKRKLLREQQFTRHTVVANITPGALPVKMAACAGVSVGGWWLALLAGLAVALPGVVGTIGLLAVSHWLGADAVRLISYASVGITMFIVVLLVGYIIGVHVNAGGRLWGYLAITAVSMLATGSGELARLAGQLVGVTVTWQPPRLSAVSLIVVALLVIVAVSLMTGRHHSADQVPATTSARLRPAMMALAGFVGLVLAGLGVFWVLGGPSGLQIGGLLGLSTLSSFGGGEAYIGVADGFFVLPGLVDRAGFYTQLVPIANALPGPILVKVAAGIGYLFGLQWGIWSALGLAAAASAISVGACCAIAMPVLGAYERLKTNPVVINIGRYILPVICGLLISVSATMLNVSAEVASGAGLAATPVLWVSLAGIAVMTVLHLRRRVPDLVMLLLAGLVSLLVLA